MLARSLQQIRPRVLADRGIVAAAHPLAVAAGIDALRKGGNAMDAAIAAALTTAVTLPSKCGLGGDAFIIHADGKTGELTAINGSGIAPRRLSRDYFVSRGYEKMPFYGPLSIGVPGAVAAYFTAIDRWCRLPVSELFSSAIHYAAIGFPLSDAGAAGIAAAREEFAKYPTSAAIFLPEGRPLLVGERLIQTDLARSLRTIAEGGPSVFYQGEMAQRIAAGLQAVGGELTVDDLSDHAGDVYEPIATDYRGYTVYETTLPSQGHIVLEEMNILENADLTMLGHNSADTLHLMIEAKKRAFADRNAYSRDPRTGNVPLETLISKPFAASRFADIDPERASDDVPPGALPEHDGDTTYLCAADADGNMVSFIHSLSAGFGSRVVAGDTGIMLNNRAGRGFSLVEGHPNVVEGGKRTMHTLNCYAIARNGRPLVVGGTPGGDQQPQWNMQVISNLIDHGMDVQAAVEAPRWQSFPGTDPANLPNPYELRIESRVDPDVIDELRRRGHAVNVLGPYAAGGAAFVIQRDERTGVLQGGADPRSEGFALGI
jgi:gamma-glutamyltranspeptidase/glutathione hydrolase